MHIFYDFELDPDLPQPKNPDHVVFDTLRGFVQARYKVLEEEINRLQNPENPSFAVLSLGKPGVSIKLYNVAPDLSEKLLSSISHEDFDYITSVLWRKIEEAYKRN